MTVPFYIYEDDKPIFEVVRTDTDYQDVSCTFEVREIVSWVEDDKGAWRKPADYEDYMELTVKWDGCSHYRVGEKDEKGLRDGYLHLCGANAFKKHTRLMYELYNRAYEAMSREPYDDSEKWEEFDEPER